jgi:hypothetical protein
VNGFTFKNRANLPFGASRVCVVNRMHTIAYHSLCFVILGFLPARLRSSLSRTIGLSRCALASDLIHPGEKLIGVYSEPAFPSEASPDQKCHLQRVASLYLDQPIPVDREPAYEIWRNVQISHGNFDATLTDKDEKEDYGAVRGYQKLKGPTEPMDTLLVSYNGHESGRGVYYLERSTSQKKLNVTWWQGEQISYDCHRQIAVHCPYVLGHESELGAMRVDEWLHKPCWLTTVPTSEKYKPKIPAPGGIQQDFSPALTAWAGIHPDCPAHALSPDGQPRQADNSQPARSR